MAIKTLAGSSKLLMDVMPAARKGGGTFPCFAPSMGEIAKLMEMQSLETQLGTCQSTTSNLLFVEKKCPNKSLGRKTNGGALMILKFQVTTDISSQEKHRELALFV